MFNTFINSNPGTLWLIMGMSPVSESDVAAKIGVTDVGVVAPCSLRSRKEDLGTNFNVN